MSDFKEMVDAAFKLDESEEIPRHINATGVEFVLTGTKYNKYQERVYALADFTRLVETMIGEQDEGDRCIVTVKKDHATATLRWPAFSNQHIDLNRELTEEAKAWLNGIEQVDSPKALAEFIEDYGEWLKAPDDVNQPNRLDLVQALTSIRITNRTDGSIEFRPHADRAATRRGYSPTGGSGSITPTGTGSGRP